MADPLDKEIQNLYDEWLSRPSPAVCSRLADQLRQSGRCDESIDVANDGLQQWTDNISISVVLARSYKDSGKLKEAASIFERVREKDSLNLIALRNLAEIAFEQERWGKSVELFEEYLFEYPADTESKNLFDQAKFKLKSAPETSESDEAAAADTQPPPGDNPVEEEVLSEFPETERMTNIFESQGITSGDDAPAPEIPVPEPGAEKSLSASPPVSPSIPTGVREPRSLYDLFSEDERRELHLEDYREASE
jgi:tetratricopeptide (TPR) repeat protein